MTSSSPFQTPMILWFVCWRASRKNNPMIICVDGGQMQCSWEVSAGGGTEVSTSLTGGIIAAWIRYKQKYIDFSFLSCKRKNQPTKFSYEHQWGPTERLETVSLAGKEPVGVDSHSGSRWTCQGLCAANGYRHLTHHGGIVCIGLCLPQWTECSWFSFKERERGFHRWLVNNS